MRTADSDSFRLRNLPLPIRNPNVHRRNANEAKEMMVIMVVLAAVLVLVVVVVVVVPGERSSQS